jgi:pimeloyl-ACP methyl ester carboxylesterase
MQDDLLYYPAIPSRQVTTTPAAIGLTYETLRIETADGPVLSGWFVPARPERAVLLFFHGNAGNISHRMESLQLFHRLGLSVLIFDYRGFGDSEGAPSEGGSYRDAEAAWNHLVAERGVAPGHVVLFGRSLGAAIAARMAREHRAAAVIVESGFTSVPELAAELWPYLPVRWLTRFEYPTREDLARSQAPVLVIHGRDDELVPIAHGRALFEAAPQPKAFLLLEGGGHNDAFMVDRARYRAGIGAFLDRVQRPFAD